MRAGLDAGAGALAAERRRWTTRLLWLACHRHPDPAAVVGTLEAGAEVAQAVTAAVGHRIGPLLWRALEGADALDALGDRAEALARSVEVHRLRHLLLVPQALELAVVPLVEAGLEPLVLKGPTVAARYPAPGLRPFEDLDLLLPRHQHGRALEVLGRAGWTVVRPTGRDRYDSVLVHRSVPEMPLELHYELEAWHDRASTLRAEELWSRRQPIELCGVRAYGLPPAQQLVSLCAHAAKPYHGFSRLVWIADLAMVLGDARERGEDEDWDEVRRTAERGRCTTAVAAALSLARLAGAQSPEALRVLPDSGWRGEALRRLVAGGWVLDPAPPLHLRFALADGRWRRLVMLAGLPHPIPGLARRLWYVRNLGHAVRRWRDLRRPGRRPTCSAA